jgi:26S proteasome regulatory subunit T6
MSYLLTFILIFSIFYVYINFTNRLQAARLHILKIHSRKMNLMRGINLKKIASLMYVFLFCSKFLICYQVFPRQSASGAETKAVCTEAGL